MQRSLWEIIMIILEKRKSTRYFRLLVSTIHPSRQFFTGAGLQERPSTLLRLKKHTPCFYKMPKCLSIPLLKHDTYLHIFLKHFTLMYCLGPSGARGWRRRRIKGIIFRPIFNNNKNSTSAQFLLLCQFYHSSILVM